MIPNFESEFKDKNANYPQAIIHYLQSLKEFTEIMKEAPDNNAEKLVKALVWSTWCMMNIRQRCSYLEPAAIMQITKKESPETIEFQGGVAFLLKAALDISKKIVDGEIVETLQKNFNNHTNDHD